MSCLHNLGYCAWTEGRLDDAERYYVEAVSERKTAGIDQGQILTLSGLAEICRIRGRTENALEYLREAPGLSRDATGQRHWPVVDALDKAARFAEMAGSHATAARLWSAAARAHEERATISDIAERRERERCMDRARTELGERAWHEEWEVGRRMTQQEAVEFALANLPFSTKGSETAA